MREGWHRYTIGTLLGVITALCVYLAALHVAEPQEQVLLIGFTVVALLASGAVSLLSPRD
jgi:hypothetical protein